MGLVIRGQRVRSFGEIAIVLDAVESYIVAIADIVKRVPLLLGKRVADVGKQSVASTFYVVEHEGVVIRLAPGQADILQGRIEKNIGPTRSNLWIRRDSDERLVAKAGIGKGNVHAGSLGHLSRSGSITYVCVEVCGVGIRVV